MPTYREMKKVTIPLLDKDSQSASTIDHANQSGTRLTSHSGPKYLGTPQFCDSLKS
jgi:hypothetical protein